MWSYARSKIKLDWKCNFVRHYENTNILMWSGPLLKSLCPQLYYLCLHELQQSIDYDYKRVVLRSPHVPMYNPLFKWQLRWSYSSIITLNALNLNLIPIPSIPFHREIK